MKKLRPLLCALAFVTTSVEAQTWPTRPVEVILPFAAGGGVDSVGRAVAEALTQELGQQVVIRNQAGAAGTLGFGALARAEPDGYTLGFGPTTPITNAPYLVSGVKYNVDSFDYICQVFENVFTIAVRPESQFKSAKDLVDAAAKSPTPLSYGHAGRGSIPHMSVENLANSLNLKFNQVTFRGDSDFLTVLLKGDLDFGAPAVSSIKGQDLRVLAVFSDRRHPAFPDAPTVAELGVSRSVPPGFNGLYAPKGLPQNIKSTLETACRKAMDSEVVRRVTTETGQTTTFLDGATFRDRAVKDYAEKGELMRQMGLVSN